MSAQFTPGPWWVELDKVFVGTPPEYDLIADADPNGRGGVDGAQPMLANALLIAAAPSLYLALVETVCELRAALAGENDLSDTVAVVEKAETALAKARGEQP